MEYSINVDVNGLVDELADEFKKVTRKFIEETENIINENCRISDNEIINLSKKNAVLAALKKLKDRTPKQAALLICGQSSSLLQEYAEEMNSYIDQLETAYINGDESDIDESNSIEAVIAVMKQLQTLFTQLEESCFTPSEEDQEFQKKFEAVDNSDVSNFIKKSILEISELEESGKHIEAVKIKIGLLEKSIELLNYSHSIFGYYDMSIAGHFANLVYDSIEFYVINQNYSEIKNLMTKFEDLVLKFSENDDFDIEGFRDSYRYLDRQGDMLKRMYDYISKNPGTVQRNLWKTIQITSAEGSHILGRAELFQKIKRVKSGSSYLLYIN